MTATISRVPATLSATPLPSTKRLAEHDVPYHLAVSLHAPNDELRNQLVPVNRKTGLKAILAASCGIEPGRAHVFGPGPTGARLNAPVMWWRGCSRPIRRMRV